ncbi:MAG: flagellar hook-associated protein FlgL [Deltaproteobacteria bacterium]|nr:flagellar hook-associated protein FlgL [Deltaproteobacteria bacterium]
MRITDNMRFNTTVSNLFNIQSQYSDLMEKISTQKKVNRASDDPIAAAKIVDLRQGLAANEQYRKNITDADNWVSITESTLSSAYKLLTKAMQIATGEVAGTADAESRRISAQNIQSYIDQMVSLANEKIGDRYLFSGSKNGVAPFSTSSAEARIEAIERAGNNVFDGTAASSATYSGTADKTCQVRITGGGSLATATAQISTDGGATWRNTTGDGIDLSVPGAMAGGIVNFGDGIVLSLDDGSGTDTFAAGDIFSVNAYAEATIEAIEPGEGNTSTGTVVSSGTYSGATDKTYTVEIVAAGDLDTATFRYSTDGGATWSISTPGDMAGGGIDLGDGVVITFDDNGGAGVFVADDTFVVNAFAKGSVVIQPPLPSAPNAFTGTAEASVTYSGATNKTFVVKIVGNKDSLGGAIPGVSNAQVSADGGRTWTLASLSASGEIVLGDNVKLTIDDAATGTFGEHDIFVVNATAGGYYQGNDDQLSMTINRGIEIDYNITGADAFTASSGTGVDVFKTLNDLKNALENNDAGGISGQLENLKNAQEQVLLNQSLCGTKASHIAMAKSSLTNLDERLTSLLSTAQNANLEELASRLSMQEIALQASYAMAAKISDTTILKFLT